MAASAQPYTFEATGDTATVIAREAGAVVLEFAGPPLFGRREIYRPVPPLELRSRWIMIQDPSMGVVFGRPSGVEAGTDSYEGQITLQAIRAIRAVELRALVFDVWNEVVDHLTITVLDERQPDELWSVQPEWADDSGPDEHRTTIVWVHRVMFEDESIVEAKRETLDNAWSAVSPRGLEPPEPRRPRTR